VTPTSTCASHGAAPPQRTNLNEGGPFLEIVDIRAQRQEDPRRARRRRNGGRSGWLEDAERGAALHADGAEERVLSDSAMERVQADIDGTKVTNLPPVGSKVRQ